MKFKGVLTLILVFAAALYIGADTFNKYIEYKFPTSEVDTVLPNAAVSSPTVTLPLELTPTTDSTCEKNSAVTTANPKAAIGKITDRVLSPYGANTSYNNVYLKNNTGAKINLASLLKQPLGFKIAKNDKPQVLIVHTHATESYMDEQRDYYVAEDKTRTTDKAKNMVMIGEIFANKLKASGIGVVHDKTLHDSPSYTGSYTRSAETVERHLKENPSIKVIIDIHRDAITSSDKTKSRPVVNINGKRTAQVMLVMGSQTGDIKNFPNWQKNLSLAVKYQQTLEVMYPSLARAITLNSAKYNQNLSIGSILLEVGSEANTFDEAKNAAEAAATALVSLLNTQS